MFHILNDIKEKEHNKDTNRGHKRETNGTSRDEN